MVNTVLSPRERFPLILFHLKGVNQVRQNTKVNQITFDSRLITNKFGNQVNAMCFLTRGEGKYKRVEIILLQDRVVNMLFVILPACQILKLVSVSFPK